MSSNLNQLSIKSTFRQFIKANRSLALPRPFSRCVDMVLRRFAIYSKNKIKLALPISLSFLYLPYSSLCEYRVYSDLKAITGRLCREKTTHHNKNNNNTFQLTLFFFVLIPQIAAQLPFVILHCS